jgi:cardiolipin synthase
MALLTRWRRPPPPPPAAAEALAFLDGGAQAFPRMLEAIRSARQEVFLEMYTFSDEGIGERFIAALSDAARRGARVRVILDGWGSTPSATAVASALSAAGCDVEIFNRLLLLLAGRFRRNHRKLLAVDGEVAFVGGLNIADEYGVPDAPPGTVAWADVAVEIRGPTAAWVQGAGRRERAQPPAGPVRIWLSGLGGGGRLRRRYVKAVAGARRRVLVAHSYFLPDRSLVRTITAAARRGVGVRLLLPGRSDVALARLATRRLYRRLLRAGVEIREWGRSVMHAKMAVADGSLLLLGSFNLDPFSLANLEALAEIHVPGTVADGERWIEARLAEAVPVTLEDVRSRTRLERWLDERLGAFAARGARWLARWLLRR